jgi:hypothetical protein
MYPTDVDVIDEHFLKFEKDKFMLERGFTIALSLFVVCFIVYLVQHGKQYCNRVSFERKGHDE